MNPVLELKNASYVYPDGTCALSSVSFSIEKGKKIAVLGGNGAGKSTMFLLLNGVISPSSGELLFNGERIKGRKELFNLRKSVGIVFQDPDIQVFAASVYEEISFGLMNLKVPKTDIRDRIELIMKNLDITHLADKPVHLISYGQKKRVTIADILVMDPEVIILDEPTSCLDPGQTSNIMYILNKLSAAGKSVVISTHDVDMAYSWADLIYVMKEGKIIKSGTPDEIFADDATLEAAGLECPGVFVIYKELVRRGVAVERDCLPRNVGELLTCVCK